MMKNEWKVKRKPFTFVLFCICNHSGWFFMKVKLSFIFKILLLRIYFQNNIVFHKRYFRTYFTNITIAVNE